MNRNKFVKGLSLFLVLATMLCMLTVVSLADAGSFSGDSDYGGWEQMLVENGAPQSDAVTRHTVQTGKANDGDYGNDRAIRNYANATERTLRLG